MNPHSLRLVRFTALVLLVVFFGYIIIIGQEVLIPFAYAFLLAFMLKPVVEKMEKVTKSPTLSIFSAILAFVIPIFLILGFFSFEISHIIHNIGSINQDLNKAVEDLFTSASQYTGKSPAVERHWLNEHLASFMDRAFGSIGKVLASSTGILAEVVLIFFYAFFLLFYRRQFKNFLLIQFEPEKRPEAGNAIKNTQLLARRYVFGLGMMTLILAGGYLLGFTLIKVKFAPFWAILLAFLNIIPYVGNALGLIFLLLFSFATTGGATQVLMILGIFLLIQTVEGNYLRPKIVGSSVNLNTFAAFFFLILGGYIWGVSGLILALPYAAVMKIIFEQVDFLRPVSELMDTELFKNESVFFEKYDHKRFRLFNFIDRKVESK